MHTKIQQTDIYCYNTTISLRLSLADLANQAYPSHTINKLAVALVAYIYPVDPAIMISTNWIIECNIA